MKLLQTIAKNMKERRRELGLSQDDTANKMQTSRQRYGKIESGITDYRVSTLERISEALEIDIKELLNERE